MNIIIKTVIISWLAFCAAFIWIGCALIGFVLTISNYAFMYNVTPFIGLTSAICIIMIGMRVYRSNPERWLESKWQSVGLMLRK